MMNGKLVFEPFPFGRVFIIAIFAVLTTGIVVMAPAILSGENLPESQADTPAAVGYFFVAAFLLALLWNAYWFLYRFSCRTTFDGEVLEWRTCLANGSMPLTEVTEIRSLLGAAQISNSNHRITLFPAKGVTEFVAELVHFRPDLGPARLGFFAAMNDRRPKRSRLSFEPPA